MFDDVYSLKSFIDQIISDSNCSDDLYINVIRFSDINEGTQRVVLSRDMKYFLNNTRIIATPEERRDPEINEAINKQYKENAEAARRFNRKAIQKLINMDSAVIEIYDIYSGRAMWVLYNKKQIRITAPHNERSDRILSQELMIKAMAISSEIEVHESIPVIENTIEFNITNFWSSILYLLLLR